MLRFNQSQSKRCFSDRQLASFGRYGARDGMGCERKNPVWMGWSPG